VVGAVGSPNNLSEERRVGGEASGTGLLLLFFGKGEGASRKKRAASVRLGEGGVDTQGKK